MVVSKLCLGTVQLGMKYGIKNDLGRQPTHQESFALLEEAIKFGIDTFDTASAYGNAEKVLGEFGIGKYPVKIISKLSFSEEEKRTNDIAGLIERKLYHSLDHLKIQALDGYLLHGASDFYNDNIVETLQKLKQENLIKNIGVSIYEEKDALAAAQNECVDYIQIPYNVFDQRLDQTEFFQMAKQNQITVFSRSSFLQGLLLMNIEQVPAYLASARPHLKKFHEIIGIHGYTPAEAALLFSSCHQGISKVVFGIDTKLQLEENLRIIGKEKGFKACHDDLFQTFVAIERKIILPSLWKAGG